jgi:serine protease Do
MAIHAFSQRFLACIFLPCLFAVLTAQAQTAAQSDIVPPAIDKLVQAARSVVQLRTHVLPNATSAATLGDEREGTGMIIGPGGLVLTIGYLILEADKVELTDHDGKSVDATVVGYDHATGFGLVRANSPLSGKPIVLGKSSGLDTMQRMVIASAAGSDGLSLAYVTAQRPFAGYWEYAIDNAIFTSPPRTDHSGAALINQAGELIGVGSLVVADAGISGMRVPGNMFVPIDLLKPILDDLTRTGHAQSGNRPWLGINSNDDDGRIRIIRTTSGSPAAKAGIKPGDLILRVAGEKVTTLSDLYRKIWARGGDCTCAATDVPLTVLQGADIREIKVRSMDRLDFITRKPGI